MASNTFGFTASEMKEYQNAFSNIDADGSGMLDAKEVAQVLTALKMYKNAEQVNALIAEVDTNKNGQVDFEEFLAICKDLKSGKQKGDAGFGEVVKKHQKMIQVQGFSGQHSYAEEEVAAFATYLNSVLSHDPALDYLMPINPKGLDLCTKCKDGVLLAKFINLCVPDTIDLRALNMKKDKMSKFQINENLVLVINSASAIGVQTVNIGAAELSNPEHHVHIVLGLVWQLLKIQLLGSIDLKNHPELVRLLEDGEELSDLLKLPPDQLLLRWFNYHLKNAGHPRRVHNFGGDVKDAENFTVLLNQIAPQHCNRDGLATNDVQKRAQMVLDNSRKVGVHPALTAADMTKPNSKLNLAFTAAIFNACSGLDQVTEEEKEELEKAGMMTDDEGDSREERAFRMWINSLGIDGVYLNSIFEDCKDGLALLRVMDRVEPGCVDWSKVELKPKNKFSKTTNANLAVQVGKALGFSLVGIGGTDIVDGNKKLLLALLWQLMRHHILKFLGSVGGRGGPITDQEVIAWANGQVKRSGKASSMASLKDKTLCTGVFFIDLLAAVRPEILDWSYVSEGKTQEEQMLNAKYAISIARKLGCIIFLLPEDIVEVRSKMILTFVASVMQQASMGGMAATTHVAAVHAVAAPITAPAASRAPAPKPAPVPAAAPTPAPAASAPAAAATQEKKFCEECGAKRAPGAKFCEECGGRF